MAGATGHLQAHARALTTSRCPHAVRIFSPTHPRSYDVGQRQGFSALTLAMFEDSGWGAYVGSCRRTARTRRARAS